jgi:autotransporter-associated beta strand protein
MSPMIRPSPRKGVHFGAASASRDFNVAAGKTLTFSGSFGDRVCVAVASFSKSGAGTLELTGSAKTNSGTVTLNGGFLKFASEAQLGTSSAATHGNLVFAGGSVEYTGAGSFSRNFLVKDGGAGFHATSGYQCAGHQRRRARSTSTTRLRLSGRALTLSGTSTLGQHLQRPTCSTMPMLRAPSRRS